MAQILAEETGNPVNHAGFEIGHVQLPVPAIIGDVAKCGTAVLSAVELYLREWLRQIAGLQRQPVDRARSAVRPPHSGHPVRTARVQMQAEGRGCSYEDVRLLRRIDGNAEHLSCICSRCHGTLRFIPPVLSARWHAGVTQVDDASNYAVEINDLDRTS